MHGIIHLLRNAFSKEGGYHGLFRHASVDVDSYTTMRRNSGCGRGSKSSRIGFVFLVNDPYSLEFDSR